MAETDRFRRERTGGELPVGVVRVYEDARVLDAAWQRLAARRRAEKPGSWRVGGGFVAAAALLFALGFGLGRGTAKPEAVAPNAARSPSAAPEEWSAPAGAPLPADEKRDDATPGPEPKRSVARLRAPVSGGEAEPSLEEPVAPLEELVATRAPARWLTLAENGEYGAAFDELDRAGGFEEAALRSSSPEELMALADVARFAGRTGLAIRVLREVTTRFESDPNAPIAAMVLGNLLSQAGDPLGASRAYALNRRLSPAGDFAEDALFREFEMAVSAEDVDRAQQLLGQYEAQFAFGRHLGEMRSELEGFVERKARAAEPESGPGRDVEVDTATSASGDAHVP